MKPKTILLIFILICSGDLFAQAGAEFLIKANRATLERRYDEALVYYDQFIQINPEDYRGYFNKGTTLFNAERYSEAIAAFSKSLSLNPTYKEAIFYRGRSYIGNEQFALAINDFSSVLSNDDANVPFLKLRAEAYSFDNQFDKAIVDLTRAIYFDKLNGELYKRRAEVKVLQNDFESAIRDYSAVEKLIPQYKMVHYIKGNLYLKINDSEFACEEFQKALDAGVVVAERNFESNCVVKPVELE